MAALPRPVVTALTLTVLVSLTEGATALVLMPLLTAVGINAGQGQVAGLADSVARALRAVGLGATLPAVLAAYVVIVGAHAALARWQMIALADVEHRFNAVLRQRLYAAITGASWRKLAGSRAATFAHLLTDEINRAGTVTYQTLSLVASLLVTLVYFAIAIRVSAALTAVVLAGGALVVALRRSTLTRATAQGQELSSTTQRLYTAAVEHIAALRTAKTYGAEERHIRSMGQIVESVAGVEVNAIRLHAGSRWTLEVGAALVFATTLYIGLVRFGLSAASVLVLVYIVARTLPRVTALQLSAEQIARFLPSYEAVNRVIAELTPDVTPGTVPVAVEFNHRVRLERVTHVHDGDGRSGIHDVTLEIPRGASVAIVGPSGAGKSTLADVLSGLLPADTGRVLIDDVALNEATRQSWKDQIGYVEQETFLFHDTVRANLLWASPAATDMDLHDALDAAGADFVGRLPAGLDTVIGDRGQRLSGGERQRVALARALIRRPRLLLLDEATNALDQVSERAILDAIDRLKGRMTIVMITHRLSSLRSADRIVAMEHGRLVESGDCGTLTTQQGASAR